MLRWLQLVSLANASGSSSASDAQTLAKVERELAELISTLRQQERSRTPRFRARGRGNGARALPDRQQLALPAPAPAAGTPAPPTPKARRKGRGGKGGKGGRKGNIDRINVSQFADLFRGPCVKCSTEVATTLSASIPRKENASLERSIQESTIAPDAEDPHPSLTFNGEGS